MYQNKLDYLYDKIILEDNILCLCVEYTKCNICLNNLAFYANEFIILNDNVILFKILLLEYKNILMNKLANILNIDVNALDLYISSNYPELMHINKDCINFLYIQLLCQYSFHFYSEIIRLVEIYELDQFMYKTTNKYIEMLTDSILTPLPITFKINDTLLKHYLTETELLTFFRSLLVNIHISDILSNNAIEIAQLLPIKIKIVI